MVRPPFHVSVCPSPALGLGWFGHRSVTPPAAPGCWALPGVSVAPFCRLSLWPHPFLLFSRRGFLPWAFVRTWVGRLRSCLGSYLLLGELSFPCPGFSLGGSCRLVVQTPGIFLESLLWFFPLASSVCCGLEVVQVNSWLSTLRSLAVEVVTLFFVRHLSACPRGATVPLDSLVLWCSWSFPSCGVPCLRLTLWAAACVGPGGCPAFSRVGPAPLSWVPLLWAWLVWEASTVFLLHYLPSGCGHPLGSIVLLSRLIANESFHWRWFLVRCSLPFRGCVVVFLRPL